MDTTAYAKDCNYDNIGDFTLDASNTATAVAVDLAVSAGNATAGLAAGISCNELTGDTGAYLTGGSVSAKNVKVTSLTDLASVSVTLGAAMNLSCSDIPGGGGGQGGGGQGGGGQDDDSSENQQNGMLNLFADNLGDSNSDGGNGNPGNPEDQIKGIVDSSQKMNNSNLLEQYLQESYFEDHKNDKITFRETNILPTGEDNPILLEANDANDISFEMGASIAHNAMGMHSNAVVNGCRITTPGELRVTAEDTSVITAVSVGAAVATGKDKSIGAGGVFSFAPVNSNTKAAIIGKGSKEELDLDVGSLVLRAEDNHRERLWSFGGGYGGSVGVGLVLSWGSFAGAATEARIEKVNAMIGQSVDILADSNLDSTYISVGASATGSKGAVTGMVNYMNFNNHVTTQIVDSTLTVTAENGTFKALSEGIRTFTDGVGALALQIGLKKSAGSSVGAALSFIYVGGNGEKDTNLTQTLVSNSSINNGGTTELLANSSTKGLLAGANASVSASIGELFGLALAGSFSWVSDSSITQVDIDKSQFNTQLQQCGDNTRVVADAASSSDLTLGFGQLDLQFAKVGAGIGATAAVLKDKATTAASMHNSTVQNTRDFTLHASGKADLSGLLIGVDGSCVFGISGSAFVGAIAHSVTASMEESFVDIAGALTIKADNHSNVGKDKGTRFTVAQGTLGIIGGSAGADVSLIDVNDSVWAKARNLSVRSGSMDVLANEESQADAIAVNAAGGHYAAIDASVVRPVLRGAANAVVTADKTNILDDKTVGIVTTKQNNASGNLTVRATNNQWMRSHLWAFGLTVSVNPDKLPISLSGTVCVNNINMAGSADALIKGPVTLNLAGNLDVKAENIRYATYTTVPVAFAVSLGLAANVNVNSLSVSNKTSAVDDKGMVDMTNEKLDQEIDQVCKLLEKADISLDLNPTSQKKLGVSSDVRGALVRMANEINTNTNAPVTSATVDLQGKSALVGGAVSILSAESIETKPYTVAVSGSLLNASVNAIRTTMSPNVVTKINEADIDAQGGINIGAQLLEEDNFHNVAVPLGGANVYVGDYTWTDDAKTGITVAGGTKLKSESGSINIGTDSKSKEKFHHVDVAAIGLNVVVLPPLFSQNASNTITLGDNITIEARDAVKIGTKSQSDIDVAAYDITVGVVTVDAGHFRCELGITQNLEIGKNASITGRSVDITQNVNRKNFIRVDHIDGVSVVGLAFPFLKATDTVNAALTIGNGSAIASMYEGDITIASDVKADTTFDLFASNGAVAGVGVSNKNTFTQNIGNKAKLGDGVKLRAETGNMTVRAQSDHKADIYPYNGLGQILTFTDILSTENKGYITSDVTIGKGFGAVGNRLTLTALNKETYDSSSYKLNVTLILNCHTRNAFDIGGTSTATITLAGGDIDVNDFVAQAQTDIVEQVSQELRGGSAVVDTNTGKVESFITQTAAVTLGTGDNKLDILADSVSITAHNKHLFTRSDQEHRAMVFGNDFAIGFGTSIGTVQARQNINAAVTLGNNAHILRRADLLHYKNKDAYKTLISATNNVESFTQIDLEAYGIINANSRVTTWDQTTAGATLNLNGTVDAWGETELTAYSHVMHNMVNSVTSGAIVPTANTDLRNTIDTNDQVNLNGTVESIGNVLIQAGSTRGKYPLVDGAAVLSGEDDANCSHYYWGKNQALVYHKRKESLTINADVRAGGELIISNDSSANTVKKSFTTLDDDGKLSGNRTSDDFLAAARDTAAEVTSTLKIGGNAKLYAGLGSAVSMVFQVKDGTLSPLITSAQRIFEGSKEIGRGIWQVPDTYAQHFYHVEGRTLMVEPLTVPGMAFRIETADGNRAALNGKLFSPAKHGLDIFFPIAWKGDTQTNGVTLLGYESGLIFNRKAVEDAVSACATPDLYRSEGVSIRSLAQGNLTLTGAYEFPYSTLYASSEHNLTIAGLIHCGSTTMFAGENFVVTLEEPGSRFGVRGLLAMYTSLYNTWGDTVLKKLVEYGNDLALKSGNAGKKQGSAEAGTFQPGNDSKNPPYTAGEIRNSVPGLGSEEAAMIRASGTVSITAQTVDLNGKIYSGYLDHTVIKPDFRVLNDQGKAITVAQADASFAENKANRYFKVDGHTGYSLYYDAQNKWITLDSFGFMDTGIKIQGTIVNSDPTGNASLYLACGAHDLTIDNQSAYALNIGDIDLKTRKNTSGIELINTQTKETTTYTLNADGGWTCRVTKDGIPIASPTKLSGKVDTVFTRLSDYQVLLQGDTKVGVTEGGRLAFQGGYIRTSKIGDIIPVDGEIEGKKTFVDYVQVNTNYTEVPEGGELTATYIAKALPNGFASVEHNVGPKTLTALSDAGTGYRWVYELKYEDTYTRKLYVSASNSVGIHLDNTSVDHPVFTVRSGDVNFSGLVQASGCVVQAGNAITANMQSADKYPLIDCTTIKMSAGKGSIGTEAQKLSFKADSAEFQAGQDLWLAAEADIGKLKLYAGGELSLSSKGAVNGLAFKAGSTSRIDAVGQINVASGASGSGYGTTLLSQEGGISVDKGSFSPGILRAEAERDISITTSDSLMLDYVESRQGSVTLNADQGITSVSSADLSKFYAVPGSGSTQFGAQTEASLKYLADAYYTKLLQYERLYYKKDKDGKYIHRDANGTFVLPEEKETLDELANAFKDLYNSGRGEYLGEVMYWLNGTSAVEGTKFANTADALAYLAQHADKLETVFVRAYYDKLVEYVTKDIRRVHGTNENVDYGQLNEDLYRLYWLQAFDENNKPHYVNQDAKGNFISPNREGSQEPVYSAAMCEAITKQFRKQRPKSTFSPQTSELLLAVAKAVSGSSTAAVKIDQVRNSLAAAALGKPAGDVQVAVRAAKDIVLTSNADPVNGSSIGGDAFRFTIKPIDCNEDGTFLYSNWASAFMADPKPGAQLVYENKKTGERLYSISSLEGNANSFNMLQLSLLQQAVPSDVSYYRGVFRVIVRNFLGVDAPNISASGKNVMLSTERDLNLADHAIRATNLTLATTGTISGAIQNSGGSVSLNAGKGLGSEAAPFTIGGSSTYTLGSDADVFLKTTGKEINLSSLTGEHVTIDTRGTALKPVLAATVPHIIGRRIDFYGDLDSGLNFRTFGLSLYEGGLHWHGGSSTDLNFGALNTAYTFWFVAEDSAASAIGKMDLKYSGNIVLDAALQSGSFHQVGKDTRQNSIQFIRRLPLSGALAFTGEGAYTVRSNRILTLASGTGLSVAGNATLQFAGIATADGSPVRISSKGDLLLSSCEIKNGLAIDSKKALTLDKVTVAGDAELKGRTVNLKETSVAGRLTVNGKEDVRGKGVSASRIHANSANAGVFMDAVTNDLSGSSHNSFVACVGAAPGSNSVVVVHDIAAYGDTGKVVVRSLLDEMLLDGTISGAALEFYSTGDIIRDEDLVMESDYPFWDIWSGNDSSVYDMDMDALDFDLPYSYVWFVDDSYDNAPQNSEDVQKLRRKVNGEEDIPTVPALRFMDKDGNTVSREQYSNLITNK